LIEIGVVVGRGGNYAATWLAIDAWIEEGVPILCVFAQLGIRGNETCQESWRCLWSWPGL